MKRSRWNKSSAPQEAAEWTEILKGANTQELRAFDEWLMESPRHVREFLLVSAVDRALDSVDSDRRHDVPTLLSQISGEEATVLQIRGEHPRRARKHPGFLLQWIGAAAAAVALAVGISHWYRLPYWQDFSTTVGEQRTLQLSDGSIVALNTQSHLQVRMTEGSRDLRLLQGQALFKVSRDLGRPFRVQAGQTLIQALGTEFDVYRHGDASVTLAVVEGKVQVTELRGDHHSPATQIKQPILSAGEELRLASDGRAIRRTALDESNTAAWRQRRLVFRRDTLATVVEEFNRYNRKPQFRLENTAIEDYHYSGEFDADDPQSLIELLAADTKLSVVREGDAVVIRAR